MSHMFGLSFKKIIKFIRHLVWTVEFFENGVAVSKNGPTRQRKAPDNQKFRENCNWSLQECSDRSETFTNRLGIKILTFLVVQNFFRGHLTSEIQYFLFYDSKVF